MCVYLHICVYPNGRVMGLFPEGGSSVLLPLFSVGLSVLQPLRVSLIIVNQCDGYILLLKAGTKNKFRPDVSRQHGVKSAGLNPCS